MSYEDFCVRTKEDIYRKLKILPEEDLAKQEEFHKTNWGSHVGSLCTVAVITLEVIDQIRKERESK